MAPCFGKPACCARVTCSFNLKTNIILIDFENVQPKGFTTLRGRQFKTKVFCANEVISELTKRGVLTITEGKVTYPSIQPSLFDC